MIISVKINNMEHLVNLSSVIDIYRAGGLIVMVYNSGIFEEVVIDDEGNVAVTDVHTAIIAKCNSKKDTVELLEEFKSAVRQGENYFSFIRS